jgi:hypothetical protein
MLQQVSILHEMSVTLGSLFHYGVAYNWCVQIITQISQSLLFLTWVINRTRTCIHRYYIFCHWFYLTEMYIFAELLCTNYKRSLG